MPIKTLDELALLMKEIALGLAAGTTPVPPMWADRKEDVKACMQQIRDMPRERILQFLLQASMEFAIGPHAGWYPNQPANESFILERLAWLKWNFPDYFKEEEAAAAA
jgi:hypothetical protein